MGCKCNGSCNNRVVGGDDCDDGDELDILDYLSGLLVAASTIAAIAYCVWVWKQ